MNDIQQCFSHFNPNSTYCTNCYFAYYCKSYIDNKNTLSRTKINNKQLEADNCSLTAKVAQLEADIALYKAKLDVNAVQLKIARDDIDYYRNAVFDKIGGVKSSVIDDKSDDKSNNCKVWIAVIFTALGVIVGLLL